MFIIWKGKVLRVNLFPGGLFPAFHVWREKFSTVRFSYSTDTSSERMEQLSYEFTTSRCSDIL